MNTFLGAVKSDSYLVVRVNKVSGKTQILKSNLSRERAMKLAKSYPENSRSKVVFVKESQSANLLERKSL